MVVVGQEEGRGRREKRREKRREGDLVVVLVTFSVFFKGNSQFPFA